MLKFFTILISFHFVQCLLLPSEVVPEDIISIKGQQFEMVSKQFPALATAPDSEKQWIDLKQDKTVMFLDSWEVKEKKEKENDQKVNVQCAH